MDVQRYVELMIHDQCNKSCDINENTKYIIVNEKGWYFSINEDIEPLNEAILCINNLMQYVYIFKSTLEECIPSPGMVGFVMKNDEETKTKLLPHPHIINTPNPNPKGKINL